MSKVFRITPKRTKRVNGQVITPEMVITVTTRQHCLNPFYNGAVNGDYGNDPPALSQPVLQRGRRSSRAVHAYVPVRLQEGLHERCRLHLPGS